MDSKLILIILLLALSVPAFGQGNILAPIFFGQPVAAASGHTFTFLHTNANASCNSPCTVTTTSTTSGSLLVIWIVDGGATALTGVTCSPSACTTGGAAYVHCSNCNFSDAVNLTVDGGYVLAAPSGVTSVVATFTGGGTSAVEVNEITYTGTGAISLDSSNGSALTTCTSCAAFNLTITGSSDYVTREFAVDNTPTNPGAPWTNPAHITTTGVIGALNQANANTFNVAQAPGGGVAQAVMAFK